MSQTSILPIVGLHSATAEAFQKPSYPHGLPPCEFLLGKIINLLEPRAAVPQGAVNFEFEA